MFDRSIEVGSDVAPEVVFDRIREVAANQKPGIVAQIKRKYLPSSVLESVTWNQVTDTLATGTLNKAEKAAKGMVVRVLINRSQRVEVSVGAHEINRWFYIIGVPLAILPPFWWLWLFIIIGLFTPITTKRYAKIIADELSATIT